MATISALFREQASVDLKLARLALQHDLSGQSLGESMFLAQQSVEKQLKAIVLALNEAMRLEAGEGFLFDLSHKFYPNLHEVRKRFVGNLGLPPAPVLRLVGREPGDAAFAHNERVIGGLGDLWAECGSSGSLFHVSLWKHSLRMELSASDLDNLQSLFDVDAAKLPDALGVPSSGDPPKVRLGDYSSPLPMREVIEDEGRTEDVYGEYKLNPLRQWLQKSQDIHLALQDTIFSQTALKRLERLTADGQARAVKRLVAEFAFEAVATQAHRYMNLVPHNTLGRYPMLLPDGKSTTEVYELQTDVVLHLVCNETRFDLEMLCEQASKLDELCLLGHEHGYW